MFSQAEFMKRKVYIMCTIKNRYNLRFLCVDALVSTSSVNHTGRGGSPRHYTLNVLQSDVQIVGSRTTWRSHLSASDCVSTILTFSNKNMF